VPDSTARLGVSLEITARFPEGVVNITNFSDLEDSNGNERGKIDT
jgi:hypothetical protein